VHPRPAAAATGTPAGVQGAADRGGAERSGRLDMSGLGLGPPRPARPS